MLDKSATLSESDEELRANQQQNIADGMSLFPKLQRGLDVNVGFTKIDAFEYSEDQVNSHRLSPRPQPQPQPRPRPQPKPEAPPSTLTRTPPPPPNHAGHLRSAQCAPRARVAERPAGRGDPRRGRQATCCARPLTLTLT